MGERRRAGTLARAPRRPRPDDIAIECFMLANSVEMSEGRFYILGGGVNRVLATQFPHAQTLAIPIMLQVPRNFADARHTLNLWLVDAAGQDVLPERLSADLPRDRPPESQPDDPLRVLAVMGMNFLLPAEGRYYFVLAVDDEEIGRTPLRVEVLR